VRTKLILSVSLALVLLAGLPVSADADSGGGVDNGQASSGQGPRSTPQAAHALARASALLTGHPAVRARTTGQPDSLDTGNGASRAPGTDEAAGPDATMALRDLAARIDGLSAEDQRTARGLLARPTDPVNPGDPYDPPAHYSVGETTPACTTHFCVHSVTSSRDAATPAQVRATSATFEHVYAKEVTDLGYRKPLSDAAATSHGPDGKVDVYLADLGRDRLFGYCTVDDPAKLVKQRRSYSSGYCVVDNDFKKRQYPGTEPLDSLRVTAAHEFFHDIQFGYDWREDVWLMEGTATWIEDEVYDSINDNFRYFALSPMERPSEPIDFASYGSWVFWRFLSEDFGTKKHEDPAVIRRIWTKVEATPGGQDLYSLQAVKRVTANRGGFSKVFAKFGAINQAPGRWYSEGMRYPKPHIAKRFTLSRKNHNVEGKRTLNHLATNYVTFAPARNLRRSRHLSVHVDMPRTFRGSAATLAIHQRGGPIVFRTISLDKSGDGTRRVEFTHAKVQYVELSLTNASTRFTHCGENTQVQLSCFGFPKDDRQVTQYTARAVR
jgi:hypothetical protein